MFDSDIEKKIINFIKKSPLGVSSSEIAKYLDINRMTLAKYLEIIKARALIDFKQLGMTKLWYIPVNINKDSFFESAIVEISSRANKDAIHEASLKLAKDFEDLYKKFYNVERLNKDQIAEAIVDIEEKIGGRFKIVEKTDEKIKLRVERCPFTDKVRGAPSLCSFTSNICGTVAARNFGYSKVHIKKAIARCDQECYIVIYLKKGREKANNND